MDSAVDGTRRTATLANWQQPPYNRWSFLHVREMVPTARIAPAAAGEARKLKRWKRPDIGGLELDTGGARMTLDELVESTFTDGMLVLHDGRVAYERYLNGMRPDTPHLLMSVSKSITATVTGILVGEGRLTPDTMVPDIVGDLRGSSFEGCSVRDLLDMRAGTRFNEDYDDPDADIRAAEPVFGWAPRTDPDAPADLRAYYPTLVNDGEHGGPFRYRSILTDLLGWVIEEASGERYAELVSRALWVPMGAEHEAEVTVDPGGNALADGGICCTLRDLARFGRLMAEGGRRDGTQIVPAEWVADTLQPAHDSVAAFEAEREPGLFGPGSYYRNKWWVMDPQEPIYMGIGIHGQLLFIHGPARLVVAKMSTWPESLSDERFGPTVWGCLDLAAKLSE